MSKTYYRVPDEGVKRFIEQYAAPARFQNKSMKHSGLEVVTDSHFTHFDFLTEEPIVPPRMDHPLFPGQPVRTWPGSDYLGQFTLFTNALTLYAETYNNGKPQDPRLVTGFKRLAELFGVNIPVE